MMVDIKNGSLCIILAITLAFGLIGCTEVAFKDDWEASLDAHYLTASKTKFWGDYSSDAFTANFTVNCVNTPWKFTNVPSWISLSPSSGNTGCDITMSVKANTSAESRDGIFYLTPVQTGTNISNIQISVFQLGAIASLEVSASTISLPSMATTYMCQITSNCSWTASTAASWLTLSTSDDTLKITSTANTGSTYRTATILITYGTKSKTITVNQAKV